jgi:16S rRNA (uracil1498-N3)-methyltransferase
MRLSLDEIIVACDQKGKVAKIKVTQIDKKSYSFEILESWEESLLTSKIIFQAQIDKVYLDKLVEMLPLGQITELVIFASDNSQVQNINLDRLNKILIRSCEQCHLAYKPKISVSSVSLEQILQDYSPIILEKNDQKISNLNFQKVLVGPEGGWSQREKQLFANFMTCSLGNLVYPAWIAGYMAFTVQN